MTIFEYFLVLFSVILSLGLTHLATGMGELVRSRARVVWSIPFLLWVGIIAQTIVDLWASAWLFRDTARFTMAQVVFLLATALSAYLAALWLVPPNAGEEKVDLDVYMIDQRRYFVGALVFYIACGVLWNLYLLPPGQFDVVNFVVATPLILLFLAAWIWPARAVQVAVPVLATGVLAIYWIFFFPSIG